MPNSKPSADGFPQCRVQTENAEAWAHAEISFKCLLNGARNRVRTAQFLASNIVVAFFTTRKMSRDIEISFLPLLLPLLSTSFSFLTISSSVTCRTIGS